ncbi:MAG: type 4a pilus biogenesis protein PilO [Candidatus Latescibacteria bacterium]|nr:type 4a pilus biogenesis protein PilO [bacterium]MBD3424212.1 type 4a pilus biogenesis protein PilO [Candidatus Latescibacterota bacterium]
MKKDLYRRQIVIAVNILSVISILMLFLFLSPPAEELREVRAKSARIRNSLEATTLFNQSHDSSELRELLGSYRRCMEVYQSLTSNMPGKQGSGIIVKKLFSAADKVNVRIGYIETGLTAKKELYGEIPVRMTVTGRFEQMEEYIRRIEQFSQLFKIDLIRIDSGETAPSGIRAEMKIKVMVREGW